jgi:uncharacterized membrane protein (DUF2068 family)
MNNEQVFPAAAANSAAAGAPADRGLMLKLIAALKLVEALVLCATGGAALELLRPDIAQRVEDWSALLPLASERHIAQHLLNSLTGLGPHRIKALGMVVFAYAALFVVEGIGLLRRQRWAEWVTVLTTAMLVPFELWELSLHATLPKLGALVINLLVVWYLVHRIRAHR